MPLPKMRERKKIIFGIYKPKQKQATGTQPDCICNLAKTQNNTNKAPGITCINHARLLPALCLLTHSNRVWIKQDNSTLQMRHKQSGKPFNQTNKESVYS
jgi:hypothetical protein